MPYEHPDSRARLQMPPPDIEAPYVTRSKINDYFMPPEPRPLHKRLFRCINLFGANVLIVPLLLTVLLALAALAPASAFSQEIAAGNVKPVTHFIRPNDVNSGSLLVPSTRENFYVEAPRLASHVEIDISGPLARVRVTQRFENPTDGWLEGVYVFPLPEDSAVDTLKMRIGQRLIEGKIKPRIEARKIFEKAKAEGKKAALLEQQRDNIFTNAIANIGPGETVIVEIEYQQAARLDKGIYSLRFPMVVAPRYNPDPTLKLVGHENGRTIIEASDPVPDRDKITAPILDPHQNAELNPVTMKISLSAGFAIGKIDIPYHQMDIRKEDETTRILTLKNDSVPANRDFEIKWQAKDEAPKATLFSENIAGQNYLLAMVTPPMLIPDDLPKMDREIIFIIDNSGSMGGQSIKQAKLALRQALSRLGPDDKFNIIRFNHTYELVFEDAVAATKDNIATARNFVAWLEADGGTQMLPALSAALVDNNKDDTNRIRQVVFITDGAIGNEAQLFSEIALYRGRSRVFTVGIGSAPNSFFMRRAAELGRGTSTHIGKISEVAEKMSAFFEKLENPVMTELEVKSDGFALADITPNLLPDLYLGEPIIVSAKTDKQAGKLRFAGSYAGKPWQAELDLAQASKRPGIGKFWARRKIMEIESGQYSGIGAILPVAIKSQIIAIATKHHLVSSQTSLVAVDVKVSRQPGESIARTKIPLNLPAGWDAEKWFGEKTMPQPERIHKIRASFKPRAKLIAASASLKALNTAKAQRKPVVLARGATPADLNIMIGLALMLVSLLIAWLTLGSRRRPTKTGAKL